MARRHLHKFYLAIILLLVLVLGEGWWLAHKIKSSNGYNVQAEFAQLPPNDEALEEWLRQQPGVVEHAVHVERNGQNVRVFFIIVQNLRKQPPFPRLEEQAAVLGYADIKATWHDSPSDSWASSSSAPAPADVPRSSSYGRGGENVGRESDPLAP